VFANFGCLAVVAGAWAVLDQHQEGGEGDKGNGQEDQ
jgi:hypothetical protein